MVAAALAGWEPGRHVAGGFDRPVYRRGTGPGVIVIHESPGLTPEVVAFADELVDAGFTVVLPHLFGPAGTSPRWFEPLVVLPRLCISREISCFATGRSTPLAGWLRDLARTLHAELGGPGVGALGMCLTGGFALAMAVDPSVAAGVVAQPAVPLPLGRRRAGDLGLGERDLEAVRARTRAGCPVLGVRYTDDWVTGTRFETLRDQLGPAFVAVELAGEGHATLTADRSAEAVSRVVRFLSDTLLS
ncbi:MAG: dienelactone hydrolase family protein [Terracoccus sp.]